MAKIILRFLVLILILNIQVFPVAISNGNSINGVTFNEPWYEVKNVAGDATIFLIDKDGDMYLDADSIDVSSVITGPFANSLVIQDAADEIFVINATNAYFSGKVYPNDASLPVKNGDDLVIQNVAGTPVAIFDGDDNSLYLSGNATHAATDVTPANALEFDGTDDYVQLPAMNPDYSGGITIEAWVNYTDTGNYDRIFASGNGDFSNNIMLGNGNSDFHFRLATYDGSWGTLYAYNFIELGKWTHIAATIAADNSAIIYKNGIVFTTGTVGLPTTINRTSNRIGFGNWAGDSKFEGLIDNVRLWNDVRTQSEILADMFASHATMADTNNLIAYWDFNQVLGSQLVDQHTNELHGSTQGNMDSDDWVSSYTERTLTIATAGNGTLAPTGAQTVADGQSFPIVATPSAGYQFEYWAKTAGAGTVTFSDAANDTTWVTVTGGDATVTAYFDYTTWSGGPTTFTLNTTATHANVATTQTDFPVLIRLTASNFTFANARGNGEDIRFATVANVPMDYEIERWDSTNALAEIWVKVPTITGNSTTDIKMHWGRAEPESKSDGAAVFETTNDFEGVWHLAEEGDAGASGFLDATSNNNDLTGTNLEGTDDVTAISGKGITFDGSDEYIESDIQPVTAYPFTMSGWVKTSTSHNGAVFFYGDKDVDNDDQYYFGMRSSDGNTILRVVDNASIQGSQSGTVESDGEWHYISYVSESTTRRIFYLDGDSIFLHTNNIPFISEVDRVSIGRIGDATPSYYWNGTIDEARMSSTNRSSDWIKLAYENQRAEDYLINVRPTWSDSTTYTLNTTATYANVATTQTDFPVLIRLNAGNFTFADAQGNGEDLRFKTSGGTSMSYEIERWDSTNALAEIWVKVPSIAGNSTTDLKMLWGNTTATSESDGEAVFETTNNFEGVWHLGETAATNRIDATSNNWDASTSYDGTSSKGVNSGIIGPADTLDADGEYIAIGDVDIQQDFTISAWVNANSLVNWARIVGKPWTSNIDPWSIYSMSLNTGGKVEMTVTTTSTDYTATSATTLSTDTWYYVTGTYDGSTVSIYVNGAKENDNTGPSGWLEANNESTGIGANSLNTAEDWDGLFDEVRISIADRGADWIKLSYENQRADNYLINERAALTITAGSNGSVADAGVNDIVNPMDLAATPNAGYTFSGWTRETNPGNLTIVDSADRVTTVTATGAGEVQANFLTKPSNALDFLGATNTSGTYSGNPNQYVQIPSLDFQSTGTYTVEAWIKWDSYQNNARPLSFRESAGSSERGTNDGFKIENVTTGSSVRFTVRDQSDAGPQKDITSYISLGSWTHVAMSAVSSGKVYMYKNGVKVDSMTATAFVGDGAAAYNRIAAGTMVANDESFDGSIDEVRIWTDIRTDSEIQNDMYNTYATLEASDNLLAYWDFDHLMGDTLYESTGNYDGVLIDMDHSDWISSYSTYALTVANDGSGSTVPSGAYNVIQGGDRLVTATPTSATFGFTGWTETVNAANVSLTNSENFITEATVTGDATIQANFASATNGIVFDGSNEYVTVPEFTLDVTNGFSIEFWALWNSAGGTAQEPLFDFGEGANNDNLLFARINANPMGFFQVFNGGSSTTLNTSANFIVDDIWTHVGITVTSGGTATIYKNGVFDATGSVTMPADDLLRDENYIANNSFGSGLFYGTMDMFRVWDDVRSAAEIHDNRFNSLDGSQANLVMNYNFNQSVGTLLRDNGPDDMHGTIVNMENGDWTAQPTVRAVTVVAGSNGSVLKSGANNVYNGEHFALSATPSTDYVFQGWEASGAGTATFGDAKSDTTWVSITGGNVTVTAYFDYSAWGRDTTFTLNTTAQYANVTSTKTDFPILIRLTSSNFEFANAMGNGEDVRFAASDEKPIAYEIERWDSTNALAELWVNVPSIAASSTTNIKMYWNKSGSADSSNSEAVFLTASSYQGVWHLAEEGDAGAAGFLDATSNNHHLTGYNLESTDDVTGVIGKGITFDGTDEYIEKDVAVVSAYPFTFSGWVQTSTGGTGLVYVGDKDVSNQYTQLLIGATGIADARSRNTTAYNASSTQLVNDGSWHHLTAVFLNATSRKIYVDGILADTETTSVTLPTNDRVSLGRRGASSPMNYMNGILDELWVMSASRGAEYVKLAYENQRAENYLMHARTSRTLTLAAGTGGSVTNSGGNAVYDDAVFSLSATASGGYAFNNWTKTAGAGTATIIDANAASTTVRITGGAVTLQANFTAITRYITVTNDGDGSNSPSGAQAVVDNENLTITASHTVTNMMFDHWTVPSGTATFADSTSFRTTVSVNGGDATVQANYSTIVGEYVLKPRHASGKCVDVSGGVGNEGDNIQIYDCNGSNAQIWVAEFETGAWHELKTKSSWRVMDRPSTASDGQNVHLWGWDASGQTNRQWQFIPVSGSYADRYYYNVKSRYDSRCLDVSGYGTTNGTNVHMWTCGTANNQEFYFQ